ncbi:MAG TPA: hypothetical protein GX714_00565 [Chloroflexi bacterium]|nr:hypothetical protein [Chloroflexota bacterium]
MSRNTFFLLVVAIGAVVVLAIAQVPQPWRGVLVAWLIVGGSVGYVAVRLVQSYHVYRTMTTPVQRRPPTGHARPRARTRRTESLQVVISQAGANGRRTI